MRPYFGKSAPWLLLLIGLVLVHHPMLLSGFSLSQNDPGDSRFNNFILEYSYRFLIGDPYAAQFWDLPIFYPTQNVTAYSDLLLGLAPPYWFLRAIGVDPPSSFQLWLITLSVLNYLTSFFFLRRVFGLSGVASHLGAFLFSFAAPRAVQLAHQQMYAQFYPLCCMWAYIRLYQSADSDARASARKWWGLLCLAGILQLYSGFYHGWFTAFILSVVTFVLLVFRSTRCKLKKLLMADWWWFMSTVALSVVILFPLASHYLEAAKSVGFREVDDVLSYLPTLWSWSFSGKESWLYGWIAELPPWNTTPLLHEHVLSAGFVTSLLALWGLVTHWDRPIVRIVTVSTLLTFSVVTLFPRGIHIWPWVFWYVPGAGAIRAVSRIGLYFLIPLAIGSAYWIERQRGFGRKREVLTAALLILMVLEQGQWMYGFNKEQVAANEDKIVHALENTRAECKAFYFSQVRGRFPGWRYQLDAMWASIRTGIPTVNGHSGNFPPGWELGEARIGSRGQDKLLTQHLQAWIAQNSLEQESLCWVKRYRQVAPSFFAKPCCRRTEYFG